MTSTAIINGHVVDPANKIDTVCDVLVENGKIKKVGNVKDTADTTIDAKGKIVTPGLIDIQVHLREPGREDKETIKTGLRAAVRAGFTSVVSMPNTCPVTDSKAVVEFQYKKGVEADLANLYVAGAITKGQKGEELADIWEMKQAGAVAVTDDGRDVQDEGLLQKAMEYCKTHDMLLMSHCEVEALTGGVMHEGAVSTKLGLRGIPAVAEDLAVIKNIMLSETTGAGVHILHVSTKGAVEALRNAHKRGIPVTAETCPQYFVLTDSICDGYDTSAKMYPPVRSEEHRKAVIEGLKDGTLSVITTDHAPHTTHEKLTTFDEAAWGSVGLETSLALSYTYLVKKKILTLPELIAKMTCNPAKVVSIPKGTLTAGADADITIWDPKQKWTVSVSEMETKGKNCVFEGMEVYGKVDRVFVGGREKVRNGKIFED
jgi:dihydroorotase